METALLDVFDEEHKNNVISKIIIYSNKYEKGFKDSGKIKK
jgi:hypothetical protein